jgi:hypothetical protein
LCLLDILKLPRLILAESAVAELTRTLTTDLAPVAATPTPTRRKRKADAE